MPAPRQMEMPKGSVQRKAGLDTAHSARVYDRNDANRERARTMIRVEEEARALHDVRVEALEVN